MVPQTEWIAFAREALGLATGKVLDVVPLQGKGSGRAYYRMTWQGNHSAILVNYDPKRVENAYQADIATFLSRINIPCPRMIRHDPVLCLIVMEDLGDIDLYSLRNESWARRSELYRKTLAIVHRLHSFPVRDLAASGIKLMEGFGPGLYEWERTYFKEQFLKGTRLMELDPAYERELEAELVRLAGKLMAWPNCLVHRDLQSQNVMILGGDPFLIDFQGMRLGSPFYDLGSLLCDPYVVFTDGERKELLHSYYLLSAEHPDWQDFQNAFWEASVQRLMQALGAYGFLGLTKGLRVFLDYIPAGLKNLQNAAAHAGSLPMLSRLCTKITSAYHASGGIGEVPGLDRK